MSILGIPPTARDRVFWPLRKGLPTALARATFLEQRHLAFIPKFKGLPITTDEASPITVDGDALEQLLNNLGESPVNTVRDGRGIEIDYKSFDDCVADLAGNAASGSRLVARLGRSKDAQGNPDKDGYLELKIEVINPAGVSIAEYDFNLGQRIEIPRPVGPRPTMPPPVQTPMPKIAPPLLAAWQTKEGVPSASREGVYWNCVSGRTEEEASGGVFLAYKHLQYVNVLADLPIDIDLASQVKLDEAMMERALMGIRYHSRVVRRKTDGAEIETLKVLQFRAQLIEHFNQGRQLVASVGRAKLSDGKIDPAGLIELQIRVVDPVTGSTLEEYGTYFARLQEE